MDRPFAIFKSLGIPVFPIWDADLCNETAIKFNQEMCRLCSYYVQVYPEVISRDFACIRTDLEKTFREEIGEDIFDPTLQEYCEEYGLGKVEYAVENPTTISALVTMFHKIGTKSETIECTVTEIIAKANET